MASQDKWEVTASNGVAFHCSGLRCLYQYELHSCVIRAMAVVTYNTAAVGNRRHHEPRGTLSATQPCFGCVAHLTYTDELVLVRLAAHHSLLGIAYYPTCVGCAAKIAALKDAGRFQPMPTRRYSVRTHMPSPRHRHERGLLRLRVRRLHSAYS